jgi:prevent-host-death family protein
MTIVNIHQAKSQLSKLLKKAQAGEEVIIAKAGKPVARLVSVARSADRGHGIAKGKFALTDEFFAPLPEDELAALEK